MLYYLHELHQWFGPLNVFQYITVRAVAGAGTAFLITLVLGPPITRLLKRLQMHQYERREEAPALYELRAAKEGTPTMGGLLIMSSICIASLLWAIPVNRFVWLALGTMLFMGGVGFCDDYLKAIGKNAKGLRARIKLVAEILWVVVLLAILLRLPETREHVRQLMVPFFKDPVIRDMGLILTFLFLTAIVVGSVNAVNLTDGVDGLAIGCSSSVALSYLVMAYAAGHAEFAAYLYVPFVSGAGELAVVCGCMVGACLGFLWYNCHPASVFMGDTGSLALGGAIATIAILIKQELVLIIVGGVFVIEAVSVILQVLSYRLTGKRIFAMAPIHHHFEMKKWSETQVTVRFWILSIIFALLGLLTLKMR